MRLAIMQPYFFPYIGYFQLISSVEKHVVLDDVNYIKGGWINRNRLLNNGKPQWMTLSLADASPNKLINEIEVDSRDLWRTKLVNLFNAAYRLAPNRSLALDLLSTSLAKDLSNLSELLTVALIATCDLLEIKTEIIPTTSVFPKEGLKGQGRIVDLCRRHNATEYVNLPGGRELYDPNFFASTGVKLCFLEPVFSHYDQGGAGWNPGLSILDVIAWNGTERAKDMARNGALAD